jgi:hypothetical protein
MLAEILQSLLKLTQAAKDITNSSTVLINDSSLLAGGIYAKICATKFCV